MKIAELYSSAETQVLQRRGPVANELYLPRNIARIVAALRENGHEVIGVEGVSLESVITPRVGAERVCGNASASDSIPGRRFLFWLHC